MGVMVLVTGATGLVGFRILLAALTAGHAVRYVARSEEKSRMVFSNPAVQKLRCGNRLSSVIVPDTTVDGAFDSALDGITHVIHAGAPVPLPFYDPVTQVFEPTLRSVASLLESALKAPTVQRVVITASIVSNLPLSGNPPTTPTYGWSREPMPDPVPTAFDNPSQAYHVCKVIQLHDTDEFVKTRNPKFSVSHIMPGYVFGRNEFVLDAKAMQEANSSNNLLMMAMLGGELPYPIHESFVHVDDVANAHLSAAFMDPKNDEPHDFGIALKADFTTIFGHVENAFPKAVAAGIFKRGKLPPIPLEYDSSDMEKILGRFKSFEDAVVDVAGQYLETLGAEKA
ncbi:putative cinnamoyl-CoA reductase [Xylariaceae sp. FL1019]|nr:putative cinnamoyl-CoA reductase [Xylariaceae sp. FL1019]